jgi:hypothetical protein
MGREFPGGISWLHDRLGSHALIHRDTKSSQGTWYRASYPPASSARDAVGFESQLPTFEGCMRLIVAGPVFSRFYTRILCDNKTGRHLDGEHQRMGIAAD